MVAAADDGDEKEPTKGSETRQAEQKSESARNDDDKEPIPKSTEGSDSKEPELVPVGGKKDTSPGSKDDSDEQNASLGDQKASSDEQKVNFDEPEAQSVGRDDEKEPTESKPLSTDVKSESEPPPVDGCDKTTTVGLTPKDEAISKDSEESKQPYMEAGTSKEHADGDQEVDPPINEETKCDGIPKASSEEEVETAAVKPYDKQSEENSDPHKTRAEVEDETSVPKDACPKEQAEAKVGTEAIATPNHQVNDAISTTRNDTPQTQVEDEAFLEKRDIPKDKNNSEACMEGSTTPKTQLGDQTSAEKTAHVTQTGDAVFSPTDKTETKNKLSTEICTTPGTQVNEGISTKTRNTPENQVDSETPVDKTNAQSQPEEPSSKDISKDDPMEPDDSNVNKDSSEAVPDGSDTAGTAQIMGADQSEESGNPVERVDVPDLNDKDKNLPETQASRPKAKPPPLYEWVVEEESEDEDSDAFAPFKHKSRTKKKRREANKLGPGLIRVILPDMHEIDARSLDDGHSERTLEQQAFTIWEDDNASIRWNADPDGLEDSLRFFQVPHEEQDPAFLQWKKEKSEKELAATLREIEVEDETGSKQIEDLITAQLQEKQASTDRSVERYRIRTTAERDKDTQRLHQIYKDKLQSSNDKIQQGVHVLRKRHQQEIQKIRQQHAQNVQQRRLNEAMANHEWGAMSQRLAAKQQRQMQEFMAKGEEVKKRCESEHKRDQDKLRKQFEKRMRDIESNRQSINARMFAGFQQLRQRYIKRHMQKIAKKKEALAAQRSSIVDDDATPTVESDTKKGSNEEKTPSPRDIVKSTMEDKVELRPPSPIKTCPDWVGENISGASLRHKHRKGVLSQITKQLSVEIHNEGIWLATIPDKKSSDGSTPDGDSSKGVNNNDGSASNGNSEDNKSGQQKSAAEDKEFIPWGVKARMLLESIICGEIPDGYGSDRFDFGETTSLYGGHIRCVLTDLRTSDETASMQRAAAVREQDEAILADLERKANDLAGQASSVEKAVARADLEIKEASAKVEEAVKQREQQKRNLQNFRTKFARYLGPDGNPNTTTNATDRQKLMKAAMQYKNNIDAAEKREKVARSMLTEAKKDSQKQQALLKQVQRAVAASSVTVRKKKALLAETKLARGTARPKLSETAEIERAAVRVKEVIGALAITAQKRRDKLDQKRTGNTSSSWVQNLPGLPGPLRKSLWHKMHRRRQQIVLRPSQETQVSELRKSVSEKLASSSPGKSPTEVGSTEEELLRAEQLFLLAVHPVLSNAEALSSVPTSSSTDQWAEPGWHIVLDVPRQQPAILPCAPSFPLLQRNLSEIHSAPGRQAASLIRTTHLRSLAYPLSVVATATSLAEDNPAAAASTTVQYAENDPLHSREEVMKLGYKFSPRTQPGKSPANPRKRSATGKDPSVAAAAAAVKRQMSSSSVSQPVDQTASSGGTTAGSNAPAKNEKKRRGSRSSEGSRPVQRRKSETKQQQSSSISPAASTSTRNLGQQPMKDTSGRQNAPARGNFNNQPSSTPMDQQAAAGYNQYMKAMPNPNAQSPGAHQRANMQQQLLQQQQQQQQQQFQNPQQRQMNQLRMMQHQQSPQAQQMAYGQNSRAMPQQMQQFFAPMPQQTYPQQHMGMPGRVVGQPGMPQMNVQGNNQAQLNPTGNDETDPLFILKDMS